MIRASLVALLMSVSLPALASWTLLFETDSSFEFIDYSTIRKDGDNRTFWTMSNLKKLDNQGNWSSRQRQVINCKNETMTLLQYSAFAEMSLGGPVTHEVSNVNKTVHIAPQTFGANLMKIVCPK
jgi:hypothetical protein